MDNKGTFYDNIARLKQDGLYISWRGDIKRRYNCHLGNYIYRHLTRPMTMHRFITDSFLWDLTPHKELWNATYSKYYKEFIFN